MKNIASAFFIIALAFSSHFVAQAQVGVSITVAPPAIPVYVQPDCPGDGYLWEPGYWAYDDGGYYWVPGIWVHAPRVGYLWTPGYWAFEGGYYGWHGGYWGPHVGFYGGVNYGCGYWGSGFYGGRWDHGSFRYNTEVMHVGHSVRNVYADRSVVRSGGSRTGFNGPGGVSARPNASETSAMHERHVPATRAQASHQVSASHNRSERLAVNKGNPVNRMNSRSANTHATASQRTPQGNNRNAMQHSAVNAQRTPVTRQRQPSASQRPINNQRQPGMNNGANRPQQNRAMQPGGAPRGGGIQRGNGGMPRGGQSGGMPRGGGFQGHSQPQMHAPQGNPGSGGGKRR